MGKLPFEGDNSKIFLYDTLGVSVGGITSDQERDAQGKRTEPVQM